MNHNKSSSAVLSFLSPCTIHPKNHAHGSCFVVSSYSHVQVISFPRPSALLQWRCNGGNHTMDCPNVGEATLKNLGHEIRPIGWGGKIQNFKTVCIFWSIIVHSDHKHIFAGGNAKSAFLDWILTEYDCIGCYRWQISMGLATNRRQAIF